MAERIHPVLCFRDDCGRCQNLRSLLARIELVAGDERMPNDEAKSSIDELNAALARVNTWNCAADIARLVEFIGYSHSVKQDVARMWAREGRDGDVVAAAEAASERMHDAAAAVGVLLMEIGKANTRRRKVPS